MTTARQGAEQGDTGTRAAGNAEAPACALPRNTQIVAANAGHHIKRDDPEFLVHVLRDMIAELRQRSSGAGLTGTAS